MEKNDKLITVAIHTYAKALILKTMLENEGIQVVINNVNLIQPVVSAGSYDTNLCHAVLVSIISLKKDINQNNRLRYRILMPLIKLHYCK